MKTILLPTDFSKSSEKALEFAISIAKRSDARIIAVNAYYVPTIDLNLPPSMMDELYETSQKESEEGLKKICKRISENTSITGKKLGSEYFSDQIMPVTEISEIAEKKAVDLIIMGADEPDNFFGFLGSTTNDVLGKVKCPVLLVKENSKFRDIQNIHLALENIKEDIFSVRNIIPLAKLFNSTITVIHVDKYAEDIEDLNSTREQKEEAKILMEAIKGYCNYLKIDLQSVLSDDTSEGLNNFLKSGSSDLLTLVKQERGWLENIFHKSVIKTIISESNIPLLIIHKAKK